MLPGSNVSAPYKKLGAWLARNPDTVYQAATDGFVTAFNTVQPGNCFFFTDGSNPPTTQRAGNTDNDTGERPGYGCLVRKNDYWQATASLGTPTVFWIPLEP